MSHWIESHQSLARHPKVIRLARRLGIHKAQAIGHLQLLWWWALDYAPKGDLFGFTDCELAAAAEWPTQKTEEDFIDALVEIRWIDPDEQGNPGKLHDWMDYAGSLIEHREAERNRKREERNRRKQASGGCPADVRRTSDAPTYQPNQPTTPTTVRGRGRGGGKVDGFEIAKAAIAEVNP
jgi:hypothetical protein